MGFFEFELGLDNNKLSLHFSEIHDLYNNVYPYLLSERESSDPEIEIENQGNYGLVVNKDTLLRYIRGLNVLSKKNGEVVEVPVYNKINKLFFSITEDYTFSKSSPHGRIEASILLPELFQIEVFIDKPYHPENLVEYYQTDIGLSFFLKGHELDWIANFWQQFDVRSPNHQEIAINQTALHEVAHLGHIAQRYINLYLTLEKAEEEYNISSLSREEALSIVSRLYDQRRFHTIPQTEAEAYSVKALKLIYDKQEIPKIISLEEPSKLFAKLGI